ncbi:hypothetical protein OB03_14370, partial [Brevundimonas sp. GN22]
MLVGSGLNVAVSLSQEGLGNRSGLHAGLCKLEAQCLDCGGCLGGGASQGHISNSLVDQALCF